MNSSAGRLDATFLDLFNKAQLQEFGHVLQAWMISRITGAADGLVQLIWDGTDAEEATIQRRL